MSAWEEALVTGIYTVSPLHVGTGQSEGAIDLPVAKEPHTGFAVIPASSLKGVARDAFERPAKNDEPRQKQLETLFGPSTKKADEAIKDRKAEDSLYAGSIVFTEARLVAYAARSLNRPFVYVTCRLVLERLARDLRAADVRVMAIPRLPSGAASTLVADRVLSSSTLVIEDLVYTPDRIGESSDVEEIGKSLAKLLPEDEVETRSRVQKNLVVIPDEDFASIVRRLPVRARIKLGDKKTTSDDDGNLWYEEQVPADCLFVSFIGVRPGKRGALADFKGNKKALEVSQIGGNETVGEGIVFWTLAEEGQAS